MANKTATPKINKNETEGGINMMNQTTNSILKESTTKVTAFSNISLDGTSALLVTKTVTTFSVVRELHPDTQETIKVVSRKPIDVQVEDLTFSLVEVTSDELFKRRHSHTAGFVLKSEGKLFYTDIPCELNLLSSTLLGEHQCAPSANVCSRLSAASDKDGGCAKVRNQARCIENFDFITVGYETFGTKTDALVVAVCQHYQPCPPRIVRKPSEINKAKLAVAQQYWGDIDSLEESRELYARKNKK